MKNNTPRAVGVRGTANLTGWPVCTLVGGNEVWSNERGFDDQFRGNKRGLITNVVGSGQHLMELAAD